MADRVLFINKGRIIFDGTPAGLRGDHPSLDDAFRALTAEVACAPATI